jgi:hypothetical protein
MSISFMQLRQLQGDRFSLQHSYMTRLLYLMLLFVLAAAALGWLECSKELA